MLRTAFNALTGLHSRTAQMRRPGNPDSYSPCRITPSNYFRNIKGPEAVNIHGREFILPLDQMIGHFNQGLSFVEPPVAGSYQIRYGAVDTDTLSFDADAASIQAEMILIPGLESVVVSGTYITGFTFVFKGFKLLPTGLLIVNTTLEDAVAAPVVPEYSEGYSMWSPRIKRGDKIIDAVYGELTIDEIVEIVDVGAQIMGFRVRTE